MVSLAVPSIKGRRVERISRSIMKSYHLQIPKYDTPIRFRPVSSFLSVSTSKDPTRIVSAVVFSLYMSHHACARVPGIHQLLKISTLERQNVAFSVLRDRYRSLLLHI